MDVGIEVNGAKALAKAFKNAGDDGMVDMLKAAHLESAEEVLSAVRAPRRTGALQATVRAAATAQAGTVRAGKSSVPYAGPIHFGWRKRGIRPNPFLYEALDRRYQEVIDTFTARLDELGVQLVKEAESGE